MGVGGFIRFNSKTPPKNSVEAKKLGGGSTVRKSPIGSTNNQWG